MWISDLAVFMKAEFASKAVEDSRKNNVDFRSLSGAILELVKYDLVNILCQICNLISTNTFR